jgi:hypothetical protein
VIAISNIRASRTLTAIDERAILQCGDMRVHSVPAECISGSEPERFIHIVTVKETLRKSPIHSQLA